MNEPLDTNYSFETPEGVVLELHTAGLAVRAMAWLIDFFIRIGLYIALGIGLGVLGAFGTGLFFIALFLIEWFYPVFFELRSGQTPGKRQYGLVVVHDDGTPIAWQASVTRNLVRAADFLPMLFGAGIVSMLFNKHFKRLGDIAAGTLVVYEPNALRFQVADGIAPVPLPKPVSMPAQKALLSFAERQHELSTERQLELAQTLAPFIYASAHFTQQQHNSHGVGNDGDKDNIGHANHDTHLNHDNPQHTLNTVLGYASHILAGRELGIQAQAREMKTTDDGKSIQTLDVQKQSNRWQP